METLEDIVREKGDIVYSVAPDTLVVDAVARMCRANVGALLVMEVDALEGIFSERDLITRIVLAGRNPRDVAVREVMTSDVVSADATLTLAQAMELMTIKRVRHLPVLRHEHLAGVVSMGDLVAWTLRDQRLAVDQLTEYVSGRYPG
jgi:signal-transduction protein with cAMP-binding, CBS, and nucleotidyltransferase domain